MGELRSPVIRLRLDDAGRDFRDDIVADDIRYVDEHQSRMPVKKPVAVQMKWYTP